MKEKFLILKGVEGFGDRLECLLQAIEYCEHSRRTLVVDWRDRDWRQDQQDALSKYFTIKNIYACDIEDFIEHDKSECSVFPTSWHGKLIQDNYEEFIYEPQYAHKISDIFMLIKNGQKQDFTQDIVVAPGINGRRYKKPYYSYIQYSRSVQQCIVRKKRKYNLIDNQYNCIHIRSKNKEWSKGFTLNDKYRNEINKKFINQKTFFQYLKIQHKDLASQLPTVIIGDCMEDMITFNNDYMNCECSIIPSIPVKSQGLSGNHKVVLQNKNHKRKLNLNTIADFEIMRNAQNIIDDNISYFAKMAKFLKPND